MGKLHKLRQAIEREPKRWMLIGPEWVNRKPYALGATLYHQEWRTVKYGPRSASYRHFVISVLIGLGFDVR